MYEKFYPQLIEVDPKLIKFNESNPRRHQGPEFFRLKESVKEVGVVQQPTVRVLSRGFYECIDGEGRIRAAQEAGILSIWAVSLGKISDIDALLMLQAANVVRDFHYLAECKGLAQFVFR
jgi:ParB family chromosome partitioning protein